MAVIDGTNLVLGRMASEVAKRLLKGEEITIVNAENVTIVGSEKNIAARLETRLSLSPKGNPEKGPKFSRMPDRFVRTAVKGMLPTQRESGRKAFRRLRVFIGVPAEFEKEKLEMIEAAANHAETYVSVGKICRKCGARW